MNQNTSLVKLFKRERLKWTMQISPDTLKFLLRHNSAFAEPVILIYYSKSKGWWGLERRVQIKHQENTFTNMDHPQIGKTSLERVKVDQEPCPIYIDSEMIELIADAVLGLEKLGMYKYLKLKYWIDWVRNEENT